MTTPTKTMMTPIQQQQHPNMPPQHSASTHSTPVRSPQPSQHSASTSSLPANDLDVIQDMIDCSANRLEGLRTQCVTSTTLTQREIRCLETKLLRMFSELLLTKGKLNERIPASGLPHTSGNELRQWLRVVGLSQDSLNMCLTRLSTLEQILELSEKELKELIQNNPTYREEEVRRLTKAMQNLRKCKDMLAKPHAPATVAEDDTNSASITTPIGSQLFVVNNECKEQLIEQLFWDSWDSVGNIGVTASPRSHRNLMKQAKPQQQHSHRQSPSNDNQSCKSSSTTVNNSGEDNSVSALTLTLTPSPPHSPFTPTTTSTSFSNMGGGSLNGTPQKGKFAGTPPPMKKHATALQNTQPITPTHSGGGYQHHQQDHIPIPLSKSKSNESHSQDSPSLMANNAYKTSSGGSGGISRSRINTDPSPDSHSSASSDILMETTNNSNNNNSLQVPTIDAHRLKPIVNLSMSHNIAHRFTTVVKMATCDLCQKPMFIGRKCKECKYRCHKVCESDVPNSCCLPPEFIEEFKQAIKDAGYHFQMTHTSPTLNNQSPNQGHGSTACSNIGVHVGSSSPGSSCNSSGPSGSALFNLQHHHSSGKIKGASGLSSSQFNFLDVTITSNCKNPSCATTDTILSAQNANNTPPNHEFSEAHKTPNSCYEALISSSKNANTHHQHNHQDINASTDSDRTPVNTDPSPDLSASSDTLMETSNNSSINNSLQVPMYPWTRINLSMGHNIAHRFTTALKMTSCDLCQKPMFIGRKCKECKYRCHKVCESDVPNSCCLPPEFIDEFKQAIKDAGYHFQMTHTPSTLNNQSPNQGHGSTACSNIGVHVGSSSPASSCNSSSPSSPALFNLQHHHSSGHMQGATIMSSWADGSCTSSYMLSTPSSHKNASQFNFPDVTSNCNNPSGATTEIILSAQNANNTPPNHEFSKALISSSNNANTQHQHHPQNIKTTNISINVINGSTDLDRTPVRLDSTEDGDSGNWPRQNSLSLKEWDIPYDDLQMLEKIGQGRFGTVHLALWHGSVAVKLLKEDYLDDEHMLEAFKLEVAYFKKTRHENLVLFMGACMNPPHLAIVTSLCKGNTLYTHIHSRREKFVINQTKLIAQQITQGMGYLHARGIIHKDLRTKNIFLENGKVIITDFGLFSSTKLLYCDRGLDVPTDWLCYLAPELMHCLMPRKPSKEILPFTKASDVYSFGTVWYEILCGEFPFRGQPPESIIWQVGRGMKQTLANLQTLRDVKDILMLCWQYTVKDRPDFSKLLTLFERLPKKRLGRSPTFPIKLPRSAEAIF